MITKEQLDPKLYPVRYWANIYPGYIKGFRYSNKEAIEAVTAMITTPKPLYRIHVRLK